MKQICRVGLIAMGAAMLAANGGAMADPAPGTATTNNSSGTTTNAPAASADATTNALSADATTNDVHCLVIYMLMNGSDDPNLKAASVTGTLYFTGKLDGRTPGLDIEGSILKELPNLRGDLLKTEAQRCGRELTLRGALQAAMGKDLEQRAEKMRESEHAK